VACAAGACATGAAGAAVAGAAGCALDAAGFAIADASAPPMDEQAAKRGSTASAITDTLTQLPKFFDLLGIIRTSRLYHRSVLTYKHEL
jgi:hypothetical protein